VTRTAGLLLLALLLPALALAAPRATLDDYQKLQQWRYRSEPVTVPAEGLRWSFAGASWELEAGKIWIAEPTADGTVTGLVFEGKGRFHMDVPDPVEIEQLRRFAKKPDLQSIDQPFSAFVLRLAGDVPVPRSSLASAPASGFAVQPLARDRHMQWLTERLEDEDSRILAALDTPGDRVLRIDMKTEAFGWLTWDFDGRRVEPVRLVSFNTSFPAQEVWVSLDPEGRGRPGKDWMPAVDIEHVDIAVDLTKPGREKDWVAAQLKTAIRFTARPEGAGAVQLYLHPLAEVKAVRENGRPVPFVRDAVGKRARTLDDRIYDNSLVVLLDEPVRAGQPRTIEVEYELQITNFVPSRDWYPATELDETFLRDLHTARLELTTTEKQEIRASGRKEDERREGDHITSIWKVDQPVKIVTFALAKNVRENFHEESCRADGVPEVIIFGPRVGLGTKGKFADVAQQVAESVAFFQQLFDQKLTTPTLRVTVIEATHGQSFEGFLQLSSRSLAMHGAGAGAMFRAHEVAHQWWGHLVGPATYRDAWLSESLAEYSAMMFVEATMKDAGKTFREVLRADSDELTGSLQSGYSEFSNPAINLLNRSKGERIGPIGLGWRASPGEVPTAYSSLVYSKGPLVLHMLRSLLRDTTHSDQTFIDILRDFARTYCGGYASTADFAAMVARHAPGDWSWFFDQWIERTAIPSYRWSTTVAPAAEGVTLNLRVRQSDVPEGFRMPVPVRIEYPDGTEERRLVTVAKADETFPLALPRAPKEVAFDPDVAVLAKVKKE
jgi:hypothetical protein